MIPNLFHKRQVLTSIVLRNNVIALSIEKLLKIDFNERFHFLDSLNFLSNLLDNLVKGTTEFKYINELSETPLLRKKLSYPYEYMDSFERFDIKENFIQEYQVKASQMRIMKQ